MTSLTRALRDERGITLAEILVATVVISIGLVGLAVVIPLSSYGVHEGNALSTATFLAEQRLEEVRNAAWTTTPSANDCLGTSTGDAAPSSSGCARTLSPAQATVPNCTNGTACTTFSDESAVTGFGSYGRKVRVTDCGTTACAGITDANMRLVQVTVTYRPMSGTGAISTTGGKSAVLEMIVSRRD
ncbi:MAG: type II secretion system protein [Candidatus Rokubacteria bacterium]|nr:type II secretion system protein [Candidatus Rokubacteria bacterium]